MGAQSVEEFEAKGFDKLQCHFDQRCLIGQPCEFTYQDHLWYLDEAEMAAWHVNDQWIRRGTLMKDDRWKDTSEARAILMPLRRAVASHLTVFDDGGAIYSIQYDASPGSGQFYLGACEREWVPK